MYTLLAQDKISASAHPVYQQTYRCDCNGKLKQKQFVLKTESQLSRTKNT